MKSLEIRREDSAGAITLKLSGTLDNSTALDLRRSLEQLSPGEVVLDFTGVRDFSDSAVAVLSRGVKRAVTLKGLRHHHQRIFAYLGMTPAAPRAATYNSADELLAG